MWALLLICCLILSKWFHLSLLLYSFPVLLPPLTKLSASFSISHDASHWCWALWSSDHCGRNGPSLSEVWGILRAAPGLHGVGAEGCVLGKVLPWGWLSWLTFVFQGQEQCSWCTPRDCQTGNFILASGKGAQGNMKCHMLVMFLLYF